MDVAASTLLSWVTHLGEAGCHIVGALKPSREAMLGGECPATSQNQLASDVTIPSWRWVLQPQTGLQMRWRPPLTP